MVAYTAEGRGMPTHSKRITDSVAQALRGPETPAERKATYVVHWCPQTPGFGVRVTAAGGRSWISERRVEGKTVRRTLGRASGRGAISADAARKLLVDVSSELQRGIDRYAALKAKRAEQKGAKKAQEAAEREEALTFGRALEQYVKGKRRGKDGLALKAQTVSDYLAMVRAPRESKDPHQERRREGRPFTPRLTMAGELHALADKPVVRITGDDVRSVYAAASARGQRRATYAMQVLRAVMNWHGVSIPGNPLGREVPGKDRIILPKTVGAPTPIPPERLAAWWQAATAHRQRDAADYYRMILLTGARPGEVKSIKVQDLDAGGGRIVLHDTKNRRDHVLLLSTQAAAIATARAKGKRPAALLFDVGDPRKTLGAINAAAGTDVSAHDLRATFASVAEELVSAYALKRMLNHVDSDVTGAHYIGKSETQLRTAWQAVADAIAGAG